MAGLSRTGNGRVAATGLAVAAWMEMGMETAAGAVRAVSRASHVSKAVCVGVCMVVVALRLTTLKVV